MLKPYYYRGKTIDPSLLLTKEEFFKCMNDKSPTEDTLDEIREIYQKRFEMEMTWRFPAIDDPQNTAVIVPLQEGFLWLPNDPMFYGKHIFYKLLDAEMLDAESFDAMLQDFEPYAKGLTLALREMRVAMEGKEKPGDFVEDSIRLSFPNGQVLRAIINDDPDYPSIIIQLETPKPGERQENLCFVEFNKDKPDGHELCIGAYTTGEYEPAYYESYLPIHKQII